MFKLLGIQVVSCQGFKQAVFDIGIANLILIKNKSNQ